MEDFNLRGVAETSARDGDAARYRLDRFQRSKAAVSVCGMPSRTPANVKVSNWFRSVNDTSHTRECGAYMNFDAAEDLTSRCNDCDEVFDQDYAAATNILKCGLSKDMSSHRGGMSETSRRLLTPAK